MTSPPASPPERTVRPVPTWELRGAKIQPWHLDRLALVYVRQSTAQQVLDHQESTRLQYGLRARASELGWAAERIVVIDDDLGKSGATAEGRVGFQRLVSEVSLDHVGIILGLEMSHLRITLKIPSRAWVARTDVRLRARSHRIFITRWCCPVGHHDQFRRNSSTHSDSNRPVIPGQIVQ